MLSILFYAGVFFMILELFTAGFGMFGIISIICFVIYFFGGVIAGYTEWWSLVLFILGIIAIAIELTIPGFGVFGAVGIVLVLLGLMFSARTMQEFFTRAGIAIIICIVSIPIMIKLFGRLKLFDKIVNKSVEATEEGYTVPKKERVDILGMTGITKTPLRPSGMAFINDKLFDVLSIEGFVDSGVNIKVIETSGNRIIVKRVDNN
jgi:membrane-bound serine protease (ClpP class)